MWDQSWWSEEREWSSGVTQPTEAKLHPSKRGNMWALITSSGRLENGLDDENEEEVMMGGDDMGLYVKLIAVKVDKC